MKKLTCATAALLMALPGATLAESANGWNGFYFGAHVGAVRANGTGLLDGGDAASSHDYLDPAYGLGGSAGLQLGYDWDQGNGFIIGAVIDAGASGVSVESQFTLANDSITTVDVDRLASARLRFGMADGANLGYVTAGIARADGSITYDYRFAVPAADGTVSYSSTGPVFGFGYERMLRANYSVAFEALYYNFDDAQPQTPASLGIDIDAGDTAGLGSVMQFRVMANWRY